MNKKTIVGPIIIEDDIFCQILTEICLRKINIDATNKTMNKLLYWGIMELDKIMTIVFPLVRYFKLKYNFNKHIHNIINSKGE